MLILNVVLYKDGTCINLLRDHYWNTAAQLYAKMQPGVNVPLNMPMPGLSMRTEYFLLGE